MPKVSPKLNPKTRQSEGFDSMLRRFKRACDTFFNNRKAHYKTQKFSKFLTIIIFYSEIIEIVRKIVDILIALVM